MPTGSSGCFRSCNRVLSHRCLRPSLRSDSATARRGERRPNRVGTACLPRDDRGSSLCRKCQEAKDSRTRRPYHACPGPSWTSSDFSFEMVFDDAGETSHRGVGNEQVKHSSNWEFRGYRLLQHDRLSREERQRLLLGRETTRSTMPW